ncbi:hypothetical protein ACFFX0_27745 [Citricoccus parietis]|uniref:Uncharacterized protein n=1 Tax=Citricoccus parietis TaxID=592307 RepID=A0ABV5G766_9MICC
MTRVSCGNSVMVFIVLPPRRQRQALHWRTRTEAPSRSARGVGPARRGYWPPDRTCRRRIGSCPGRPVRRAGPPHAPSRSGQFPGTVPPAPPCPPRWARG